MSAPTNPLRLFVYQAPGFTRRPVFICTQSETAAMTGQVSTRGAGKIDTYVRLGAADVGDGAAERAAMFDDLAEYAVVLTETATASSDEAMTLIRRLMSDGAEVARLRAALAEIAALQPRDPELAEIHYGDSNEYQRAVALFRAAEMARKGLGS